MNSRLTNIILPILACIIYVCFDFLYVYRTRKYYEQVVEKIQKEKMQPDLVAALICYAIMAIGWYLVTTKLAIAYYDRLKLHITSLTPITASALGGLLAGAIYGFVVYGVYNCTTRTIFASRYPLSIMIQDVAWGTLYNMVYTTLYMLIWYKLCNRAEL